MSRGKSGSDKVMALQRGVRRQWKRDIKGYMCDFTRKDTKSVRTKSRDMHILDAFPNQALRVLTTAQSARLTGSVRLGRMYDTGRFHSCREMKSPQV